MKSFRERNILIAVLGVAGLGLLIDRVVIGSDVTGPSESSASVIDAIDPSLADPSDLLISQTTDPTVRAKGPAVSVAQKLRQAVGDLAVTDPSMARDAFAPGEGWRTTTLVQGVVTDNTSSRLAAEFKSRHKLEAVLALGDNQYAVIGGQTLHIGQELDGFKLVAVYARSAIFESGGIRVEVVISTGFATP